MLFRNYKLPVCRQVEMISSFPKRLTHSHAVNDNSTPLNRHELIDADVREGVLNQLRQFEGFYHTHPPNRRIEMPRLGVRTETAAILRQQGMNDNAISQGIINERITQRLRVIAGERVVDEHQERGFISKKFHSVTGFLNDITNPVRAVGRFIAGPLRGANTVTYDDAHERHLQHTMHHLFGNHRGNVPQIAHHIVHHIDAAQMAAAAPLFLPPPGGGLAHWLEHATVADLEARLMHIRQNADRPFLESYELLTRVRQAESEEHAKILSIDLFDPPRLSNFLNELRVNQNEIYRLMTEQILEKDAIQNLDANEDAQALLGDLLFVFESNGGAVPTTQPMTQANTLAIGAVRVHCDRILTDLPDVKETQAVEGQEQAENLKYVGQINEQQKAANKQILKLQQTYGKTAGLNASIAAVQQRQTNHAATPPVITLGGTRADPDYLARVEAFNRTLEGFNNELHRLEQSRVALHTEINGLESEFKETNTELVKTMIASITQKNQVPVADPDAAQRLITDFHEAANEDLSTYENLFGAPGAAPIPSDLQIYLTGLNRNNLEALNREIDTNYKRTVRGKVRVSARHMLALSKEIRLQDAGVTDPDRRRKMGIFAANLMIADVESIKLYQAGNREIAQSMIRGFRGFTRRAWQSIAMKFFNSNTFAAREMMDHVAEVDTARTYGFLKHLSTEPSLADLRHVAHEEHLTVDQLQGARMHLQKILEGLTVGKKDKVEINDEDGVVIEHLCHNLLLLETEIESRAFFDNVYNPKTPEDAKLSKVELVKKLWAQTKEHDVQRKEGIVQKLLNFPNTLKKYLMTGVWGKPFEEGVKYAKDHELKGAEREAYLNTLSIPKVVLKHLMTALALKEAYDIGKGIVTYAPRKALKGAKHVKHHGGEMVSKAYEKLGKPAAEKTVGTIRKAGKFVFWTGPGYVLKIPKKVFYDAPMWALGKMGKAVAWPFRMLGEVFKAFHYPSQVAKRKARGETPKKDRISDIFVRKPKAEKHGDAHGADAHGGKGKVDVPHGKAANDNAHDQAA